MQSAFSSCKYFLGIPFMDDTETGLPHYTLSYINDLPGTFMYLIHVVRQPCLISALRPAYHFYHFSSPGSHLFLVIQAPFVKSGITTGMPPALMLCSERGVTAIMAAVS